MAACKYWINYIAYKIVLNLSIHIHALWICTFTSWNQNVSSCPSYKHLNKPLAITFTRAEEMQRCHLLTYPHFHDPLWNNWDHEDTLVGFTNPYVAGTKADESGSLYEHRVPREICTSSTFEPANVSSLGEFGVYMCVWDQEANEWGYCPIWLATGWVWNVMQENPGSLWNT